MNVTRAHASAAPHPARPILPVVPVAAPGGVPLPLALAPHGADRQPALIDFSAL